MTDAVNSQKAGKIELRQLGMHFPAQTNGSQLILNDINFSVAPGEFVSVVGPSGCGKSTLLRILAGLAKPTRGIVRIAEQDVTGPPPGVGFMFQRDTLLPWATVAQNIAVGADLARRPTTEKSRSTVADLIALLRLEGFEHHRPHQLSGGMRQRVALGRLLAYQPDIYLMDEPFGALDSQTKVLMGRELLRIWSTRQRSVVFVTHDIEEAVTLSDRVIVLSARPGTIKRDIRVEFERPREQKSLRRAPAFNEICETIWDALDIERVDQ